jgi:hypothetical protein
MLVNLFGSERDTTVRTLLTRFCGIPAGLHFAPKDVRWVIVTSNISIFSFVYTGMLSPRSTVSLDKNLHTDSYVDFRTRIF